MIDELQIGSVGVSVILSIILRMIYGTWEVDNRYKSWISVLLGIGLALIVMYSTTTDYSIKTVASFMVQGLMVGATATGFYEMTKGKTG